jgi:hypothetical protein
MTSYAFGRFSVTSWGPTSIDGLHVWRVYDGSGFHATIRARRDVDMMQLYEIALRSIEG